MDTARLNAAIVSARHRDLSADTGLPGRLFIQQRSVNALVTRAFPRTLLVTTLGRQLFRHGLTHRQVD